MITRTAPLTRPTRPSKIIFMAILARGPVPGGVRRAAGPVPPGGRGGRHEWMDLLRGLSIGLVVVNHALGFVVADGGVVPRWLLVADTVFSPTRMPAMVFLSGMLAEHALRKGSRRYVVGKLRMIGYPYLLWSAVMVAGVGLASSGAPGHATAERFWRTFYAPVDHLWFLAYLLLYYLGYLAVRRLAPRVCTTGVLGLAALPLGAEWQRFWMLAGFFLLGALLAPWLHGRDGASTRWVRPVGLGLVAVLALVAVRLGDVRYHVLYAPLVLIGIVTAARLARSITRWERWRPVTFVGRSSLVYYLLHWPVLLVVIPILARVLPLGSTGLLVASVTSTLVVCTAVVHARDRWVWPAAFFECPSRPLLARRRGADDVVAVVPAADRR